MRAAAVARRLCAAPVPSRVSSRPTRGRAVSCDARDDAPVPASSSSSSSSSSDPAARGPLRKRDPITPDALRAFIALRRAEFGVHDDASAVPASLRLLARRQTAALERGLPADDPSDPAPVPGPGPGSSDAVAPDPDETLDVLFRRRLLLLQARRGYRCNVDSLILAAHVAARVDWSMSPRVADLGAGAGVVGLALALRGTPPPDVDADSLSAGARALLVEQQPALARRCERNAALNGVAHRVSVCLGDVADVFPARDIIHDDTTKEKERETKTTSVSTNPERDAADRDSADRASSRASSRLTRRLWRGWRGTCDAVACNPPYYAPDTPRGAGTLPAMNERRAAHYETTATLGDFAVAAAALLREDRAEAAFHLVYPADRADAAFDACAAAGLGHVTFREVFNDEEATTPTLVLVEARRGTRESPENRRDAPRLNLYANETGDVYCEEIEAFIRSAPPS
jgi:tRNA1(Val) A37 N6-methylase TrmN6